ncbi:MAG: coproporphyrinogen-III oxidase family protein [Acidobacteriaceae bacterium]
MTVEEQNWMVTGAGPDASLEEKLGVYISVPFCHSKCSFCNFASGVSSAAAVDAYVTRLCQEIASVPDRAEKLRVQLPRLVDTVYFGGGTPSLLSPGQLGRIFSALREIFEVAGDAEITLEAAPGQIGDALLDEALNRGVNRISLGVQSFVDRESAAVGRSHTGIDCVEEVQRLQRAGISDLGADLIVGLPYQTEASWQQSLRAATGIGLTHLSVYILEVDDSSRLGREALAGGRRFHAHALPSDEVTATLYASACEWLPTQGFAQYEISNFAAPEHLSRHNCKYWLRAPYIGFGLDAHSMLLREEQATEATDGGFRRALRFANPEELAQYHDGARSSPFRMAAENDGSATEIGRCEAFEESVFLGLRMNQGISPAQLGKDFSADMLASAEYAAGELMREGLMVEQDARWRLTLRGRLLFNEVFTRLLMDVAA